MSTSQTETMPLNILIIDDELSIRRTLAICLEGESHTVTAVSNARAALTEAGHKRFDLAFLDIRLGTDNGMELLSKLLETSPWLKVVMITAYATINSAVEAMRRGAFDYVPKPFSADQITSVTNKVAEVRALESKVQNLQEQLQQTSFEIELKTHSPVMQKAIDLARQVASSDATILITGENGTGKGVLARAIHTWSKRCDKPFSIVSCPSLSAELLESELFGHVKGAFTGAIRQNPGRIASCEGGTLFLDEIAEIPLALQAKLLRFIQDREYEAIGDHITRSANVRIIAATNVNLNAAVKHGMFREDLFYRLNVIQIDIPPLRARAEDIPLFAEHFLKLFMKDKRILGISPKAMSELLEHSWPGNIRELRNIIERATILCHGSYIEPSHLVLEKELPSASDQPADMMPLEQIEEAHIRRVLNSAKSMDEAARVLKINTVTLWRRRKKYGI